jgi:predicted negative regulator of RcsB-dependent stress response
MAEPIDELVQRWKQSPSPAATIALCDALRATPRGPLVQQVGEFATQRHATDVGVLIAVARMYLESHRLGDAQAVLVAAGKQAPRDGVIYRWLGEVLLRRGDAERAEKVLERAIQLGARDQDAQLWMERARVFRPMQAKAGTRAVAAEVAHATAHPMRPPLDSMSDSTTAVHVRPVQDSSPDSAGDEDPTRAGPLPPIPAAGVPSRAMPPIPAPPIPAAPMPPRYAKEAETAPHAFQPPGPPMPPMSPMSAIMRAPAPSASGEIEISVQQPLPTSPAIPKRSGNPFEQATNGAPPAPGPFPPYQVQHRPPGGPMVPHPRDVLDALALSGVFEPPTERSVAAAAWANANHGPKRKGGPTLIVGMVLFLAASVGIYFFYRHKRAGEHVQAEAVLDKVETELHAGKPGTLPDVQKELSQAFQLESRSPRGALDWTRERALVGLVTSGADVAFEDAMARNKDVGVPEEKYAFARVASFLFQGDTAGAAAVLPRWDGPAGIDPWYQMVAGATLERAGDAHARDRYATAAKLDPDLVIAQVAQARATAIDGDVQEGMRLAKALRKSMQDRAEPVALVALAWGRDPNRESVPAPPEADEVAKRADELPSGLKFVPHAIAALRAFDKKNADEARAEILKGLAVAESPGAAVWLGTIALPLGDEALARKGALGALQLSAVYEPARALAARVALLGGRLDEALKATEDLEPTSPDVAVVRAAAAYERADADGVMRALEALPPETRKLPFLAALDLAPDALSGKLLLDASKLTTMAADDAPWSDLVAMDTALDEGDLASADKMAASWGKGAEANPLRALRLARLARYEGKLDAAETLSLTAMEHGTVTPRVLWERVYVLVARSHGNEVGPLLSHFPLVLGPLASWLSAYAAASGGNTEGAKGRTASLDPPPAAAALQARVVAAVALGAMKDKRRGTDYVREVLAVRGQHPDIVAAALALGFRKVEHGKRPATYDYP